VIAGSNPAGGHGCLSVVSVVWCQVEVSASGRSLVQRNATECDVSECDREASIMRRPWPIGGFGAVGKKSCKDSTVVIKQTHTVDLEQRWGRQITVKGKLL
jgi:hypothetical protein